MILGGIARAHLIANCRRLGIPVREEPFTADELMAADEIITTSSSALCLRAGWVNGTAAGLKAPELYEVIHRAVIEEYEQETEA